MQVSSSLQAPSSQGLGRRAENSTPKFAKDPRVKELDPDWEASRFHFVGTPFIAFYH